MTDLVIAPVVEGHGDEVAVPILLRRLLTELIPCDALEVLRPIRIPKSKLMKASELQRAVELADLKLKERPGDAHRLILVLFDADEDPACMLGPRLDAEIREARPDLDVAVVLAVAEYETWFIAAAESLVEYIDVSLDEIPSDPEEAGAKKAWLRQHFLSRYTETIEQPKLTATMDLQAARRRSRSFDKLCRELEKRVG